MVSISLETDCDRGPECNLFAAKLYSQLSKGYDVCSVLPMPQDLKYWRGENRTARKRANHALNLGYKFHEIRRHEYVEEIYKINTSLDERQGRPMSDGYRLRPSSSPDPVYTCDRHGVHPYGVFDDRCRLRAYLWIYRSGELALVSQILGHGAHLRNDVMWLLWQGMLEAEIPLGGYVVYNRHDSGTDGLRYYKEKVGLRGTRVQWTA